MSGATNGYHEDLAYIHDAGHTAFASEAAPGLLEMLRESGVSDGLVVDLACGNGVWAAELLSAGYAALGIDISPAMLRLARKRAPGARFVQGSLFETALPPCAAVTCVGEGLNYCFGERNGRRALESLFVRVHSALQPGGLFVFDVLEPDQTPRRMSPKYHSAGADWAVLREAEEDKRRRILTRHITTFRRTGKLYRRGEEVHRLQLYERRDMATRLRRHGFTVRILPGYGAFRLGRGHAVLAARKH